MEDIGEEWTVSSNSALNIALVDENGKESEFHPKFTYPIYGDQELIYGYKDLKLDLKFDATTLLPLITSEFSSKLRDLAKNGDVKDPVEVLKEYLPQKSTCTDIKTWEKTRQKELEGYKLPGKTLVTDLKDRDGATYSICQVSLKDLELHQRLRIFILFFIEAGSYIDEADERWEFYLIYRTDKSQPRFAGFSSVYPYFWYKDSATHAKMEDNWPLRVRISQFVILPPYQGKRLGNQLYSTLFDKFLQDPRVHEVTVEDPSEEFDDLRDRCDLERLAKLGVWSQPKFQNCKSVDSLWMEKTREKHKIAPRQWSRCVEMAFLHKFGDEMPDKYYKLFVKRRLYIRNMEALAEMEKPERIEKLDEVFVQLVEDYLRILEPVDFSEDKKGKKRSRVELEQ